MKNLFLSTFTDSYLLLIILVVIVVAFLVLSLLRRKKEDSVRTDLNTKIVPGAQVKTYSGLYGKVISITDTTDGKIVLLESGEGKKVSYQQIHINAIFGVDTKKDVVYDENGNDITFAGEEVVNDEETEKIVEEEENVEGEVIVEEVKTEPKKKSTTSKSTAKKSTNKGNNSKK